ncbi:MAG TPA: ATP-binding protein [Terriglobales bacterium]|nr:ATP-binding protein [Terriglobales bacterium]
MASPQMRVGARRRMATEHRREPGSNRRVAARLLAVERTDAIFPVLLQEIVVLGFPRALVASVNLETGDLAPTLSVNFPRTVQQRFRTSLHASENTLVKVLRNGKPAVIPGGPGRRALYCHPILFRSRTQCREAERRPAGGCLAVDNQHGRRKLCLPDQVCATCGMRGYSALVVVELAKGASEREIGELRPLVGLADRCLARLSKSEHYYNRLTGLENTLAQMQTVMGNMHDPVVLTDNQHRVVMQNRAAERFFKLPEAASEGRARAIEFNHLLFSAALSSMALTGAEAHRDLTLVDPVEGEELLFEVLAAPTSTPDGSRSGMVTVLREVTALRRTDAEVRSQYDRLRHAEELVRQDRDRLNLIIENVGDPIVVCDSNARPVLVDPLAAELFGSERDSARDPRRLRNHAKFDAYISSFTFSFSDRESGPLKLFNPTTRGEVEFDARSGKIYDERGQVAYTVTVLRDLTAVRKVEQLKVERRMLEIEKFAATGRLAGTIAHEVNNPMEAIKNAIYLLSGKVSPEATPVYDVLKSETERVARIVRQMLGLYRNTDQIGTVDVNSVIEDTLLLFRRQLQQVSTQVRTRLASLPMAVGSADQLRQVLSNLVVNARDSMEKGGTLHVRTRYFAGGGDSVRGAIRILVADSGAGIPPALQSSIFEPFVSTKGAKGTGLGLWIVKGIIENHGGKIRVRSRVGQGTVFQIDLPVVR